ncbi:hypothetical protein HOI26_00035 [Candidatus Woesearchaeota archaeon]|nr:hypothetical protein [Candidatus Woesearchaeota archaeon]MBT5739463.1 hypothetical protein [Candidatus Woesearchaeota archaeon]
MEKTYQVKSIVISRKPRIKESGFKTAFIGLFKENNPHLKGDAPSDVLEIAETEKIRIHELRNVSYYLMGNDIVINNLEEVKIAKEGNIVTITGKQDLPDN